jgi:hypothetical protein
LNSNQVSIQTPKNNAPASMQHTHNYLFNLAKIKLLGGLPEKFE